MDDVRFADHIQRERERLHRQREEIFNQQQELENRLAALNRESEAIDAYEAAKTGKAVRSARQSRSAPGQRARRGSKRKALLEVIRGNPDGLKRGEFIERMGLKADKAGQMSVSNALTVLTKSGQVSRHEGKYVAA
jgi:hypothetical protein